ncbi:MAG TPA: PAS domain S-box protein [Puia sp.]|nr:PAS domain S-box protein [Puia sp.]
MTHSPERLELDSKLQLILPRWTKYFALMILVIGILVLAGWQWDIIFFKRPLPPLTAMNPLTALCFLMSGGSMLLLLQPRPTASSPFHSYHMRLTVGKILAILVLLLGILRFLGAFPGIHLPVDQVLFAGKLAKDALGNQFSQMTLPSAFCFILCGACVLTLNLETSRGWMPCQYMAMLIGATGTFSMVGYLYHVQAFYGSITYIPMAIQTATCFTFFSAAILFAHPGKGIMKEFTSSYTGSLTARSLLPLVILLPVILGYLRLVAYWKQVIPTEFGVLMLVSSIIFTFSIIVWYNTRLLNKRDKQKRAAENTLQESEERFRLLVSSVKDYAILMLDPTGHVISWNDGAERIKGYKKDEIVGKHISVFYTQEEVQRGEPQYNLSRASEAGGYEHEGWRVRKDGSKFWANVVFTAVHNPGGEILGFAKVTRDITERKQAEEQIAYMARLMEDTTDAIFSTDESFTMRSWNKAAELLFGYSLPEVKGRLANELLRTQLDEEVRKSILEELKHNGYWKGEVSYLKKDNSPLIILITISGVRNSKGERDGYVMVCRDFTERKKMEQQLRDFNEDLEEQVKEKTTELTGIFERITDAFIAMDKNLCYTYLNKKAGELIHRDPASLIGKWVWDVFPDAIGSDTYLAFNKAMSEQRNMTNIDYYPPLNLWQENHLYPSPEGLSVFIRDITEQKKSEKAITDYKYALDQSSIVSITDQHGVIRYVNDNFCQISKYGAEELIGHNHRIIGSGYHSPAFIKHMWATISKGKVWKGEFRNKAKDGSIYWVDMTIIPFLNENKQPYEYLALDTDITERKKAGELLQESYQEIRQLASHLQEIREEERSDIAREIHDELGQQLTGLKMDLSWIGKREILEQDPEISQKVVGIMDLLDTTIKTVRRIATDLRPSILDDLGLIAAIEWQSQEFQKRSGIGTEFISAMDEFKYSSIMAIGLFRICQESLTNVARHSGATNVCITLFEDNGYILLKIEDNGKGFEVQRGKDKKTLGLLGMRERALMMGGDFTIDSQPGKGTILTVIIPLTPDLI